MPAEHSIAATFIPESKLSVPWLDVFVDAGGKSRRLLRSVNLMYMVMISPVTIGSG